ncbi:MAG: 30S ribosomal protein S19 [Thermoplasmata archaeon]|uniref:Small ribosomal subunit protein uS19 n=1 Tax=Candidatus Sysuiplasma superficiale TaxID=2823368 RepID=A0A8J7YSG5_9ARCH|nr:30S ribosomal protein S19 [Candidatus Sysuiplasma superficiale]MBX8644325.1 30S ribosomal protein S19 [Candidatus Sysuiplasma superficiale]MCL4347079.1 30S ribosomal protein S19 [Candidatus Thermoplasmatota archaeon]
MAEETLESKLAKRKTGKRKSKVTVRKKKEFTFRGFTLEEMQRMTLSELLPLLPARARRSYKRGLNREQQAFVDRLNSSNGETLKTHRREIFILPTFVGKKVAVHNGKEFKEIEIKPEMIGHALGEFAQTRRFLKHSGPGVGATRGSKFLPLK